MRLTCLLILALLAGCTAQPPAETPRHDLIVRGGTILDGSGSEGYVGDVVVDGDRIVYVGKPRGDTAATVIDATGKAVSPGFINMLSWAVESLIADGRSQSDLRQGVTLEVFGEGDSLGPLTAEMIGFQTSFWRPVTRSRDEPSPWRASGSRRSTPVQKKRSPVAVKMTTRTSESSRADCQAAGSSSRMTFALSELPRSGRSSVMTATWPSFS